MRRILALPLLILAGLALVVLRGAFRHPNPPDQPTAQLLAAADGGARSDQPYAMPPAVPAYGAVRDTTVPDPSPDATAAIVYQLDTEQVLWSRNAVLRVPIASLTKLVSALVARELWTPDELVTVASDSVRVDGQRQTLFTGEQLTVHDLIEMMLVESSNDAADALAAHARQQGIDFIAEMNTEAWRLKMYDCAFRDPAGLDDQGYCTASDLVQLVRAGLQQAPDLWPVMASSSVTIRSADGSIAHRLTNTDELLGRVPGIVAGKTGNTDGALGCLLLVVQSPQNHDRLVTVVLGSRQRFTDTELLLRWASAAYGFE